MPRYDIYDAAQLLNRTFSILVWGKIDNFMGAL